MGVSVVGLVFLLAGSYSLFWMGQQWVDYGVFKLNIFVFTLFVGVGLMRGNSYSRVWAKAWLAFLSFLLTFIVVYAYQMGNAPLLEDFFGVVPGTSSFLLSLGTLWIFSLLPAAWMWRVLNTQDANNFFDYEVEF